MTVFQKDSLNLAMIRPMVTSTIECLEGLLEEKSDHEKFMQENLADSEFRGIKLTYADERSVNAFTTKHTGFITDLITSLKKRFPEDSLNALYSLDVVLNPSDTPIQETNCQRMALNHSKC